MASPTPGPDRVGERDETDPHQPLVVGASPRRRRSLYASPSTRRPRAAIRSLIARSSRRASSVRGRSASRRRSSDRRAASTSSGAPLTSDEIAVGRRRGRCPSSCHPRRADGTRRTGWRAGARGSRARPRAAATRSALSVELPPTGRRRLAELGLVAEHRDTQGVGQHGVGEAFVGELRALRRTRAGRCTRSPRSCDSR